MKITHILGHNSNWSIETYLEQQVGDNFLISAFNHGLGYKDKKLFKKLDSSFLIDLQFYGKKASGSILKGKLSEIPFHPANCESSEVTNIYFDNCVKNAISYQIENGYKKIIIPHYYENEDVRSIIYTINSINRYISTLPKNGEKFYMTLPFANHVIIDKDKVEEILVACTDMKIKFDGYFIVSENKPEEKRKVTTDIKVLRNLSKVFKTLKQQQFETIYAYSNWDAIIFLTQTDIDYITIGNYENLRNFNIKRFTENESGGASKGYYFSEKLLNMIRADDIAPIRETGHLDLIKNERNIFSDIILHEDYKWNIHKPDVNKNYLLSISKLLKEIASIEDYEQRKIYVLGLIERAIHLYRYFEINGVYLNNESSNYHLNVWKTYLFNS
ncbi:hypothetical protein [Larkinella humicola]|uniref:Uncharacterized protein n=1 Tax=Larkinella humicola TaxID=2607654 RepID=A0A5N1JSI8_9BACT|nr:hypothetical protein [Larkinella humicola]KAA9357282.1 hypothetical protein F0P93_05970 [Larkinella humicola]